MSKKVRASFFAVFVGVFLISYMIGSTYKMSGEELKDFLKDFESLTSGIDYLGIFSHNITASLPMFIPGFGIGWGVYTAWSTGAAFGAFLSTNPSLAKIPALAVFVVSPYGVMELAAYSIAMSRSLILLLAFIKNRSSKTELRSLVRPTLIEIGIVAAILLVAAFIEFSMINSETSSSLS